VILWLLKEYSDKKRIQAIYTPEKPASAAYKRAVDRTGDDVEVKYDFELLELLKPIKYSELEIPKIKVLKDKSGVNPNSGRALLEKGNINGYTLTKVWGPRSGATVKHETAQFPREEGGVYIEYDYKLKRLISLSLDGKAQHVPNKIFFQADDLFDEDIIGLSSRRVEMIKDNPNWIPFITALNDKLSETITIPVDKMNELLRASYYAYSKRSDWGAYLSGRVDKIVDDNSVMSQWITKSQDVLEKVESFKEYLDLLKWSGYDIPYTHAWDPPKDPGGELYDLYQKAGKIYPLLRMSNYYRGNFVDSAIDYINLVDKAESERLIDNLVSDLRTQQAV
jgi:hypothetical protein